MSDVSRARLVGLLETERTALRLMNESLFQGQLVIWTSAVLLVALAVFAVIRVRNQRLRGWLEKKWRHFIALYLRSQKPPGTSAA